MCYWCRERTQLEQPLNGAAFDGASLQKARLDMQERNEQSISAKTDTTPSVKMDKLDPTKWNNWSRHFRTYLSNIQGEHNVSLDCVIRAEPAAIPLATMDPRERGLYDYPLTGDTFRKDNQKTYRLLVELVGGTAGWTWIQAHDRAQNGRAAWLALYDHYEGGNQRKKRTVQATNTLEKLYYSNESAFPFEKFAAELIQCFDDLEVRGANGVPKEAWKEFYGDLEEEIPPFAPEPLGRAVDIFCWVDANHAGNLLTRRSHTGILILVQNAPIIWYSKKQNTVELSSFGSKFVAMRTARDCKFLTMAV